MLVGKIVEVTLSKFVADQKGIARFVKGEVIAETAKAVKLINVTTVVKPEVACCHCGTTLKNPISRRLGVGPVCVVKYGPSMWGVEMTAKEFNNLTDAEIKKLIRKIESHPLLAKGEEMWVPKSRGVEVVGEAPKCKQAPVKIAGAAFTF